MNPAPIAIDSGSYPPDTADHRAERNRRLKLALVVGIFTKPFSLLSRLIVAPMFLAYLVHLSGSHAAGTEGFGLYGTVISMAMLLSLTNLGLHLGLVNRLLDCHVSGNRHLARQYVSSLMVAVSGIMAACLLAWTVASIVVPWARVFGVTDPRWARQTPWIVWIAGCTTLLNFVFAFPNAIYTGYQENARSFGWDAAVKIGTFLASVAVVYTKWGLIGIAVATCGAQLLVMIVNTASVFLQKPWLRPSFKLFEWRFVSATLREGVYLFALQGAVSLIFQCDKLIISTTLSASDVTNYQFVGEVFLVAYGLYFMLLGPLWSFHGEALRRGDWAWVRKGMYISLAVGVASIGACMAVMLIWDDWIFRHWTHGQITHVPRGLILAIGWIFLLRIWVDCRSVVLNGAGVLLPQVWFFIAHAVLNLVVALLAAKRFGVLGIAWATPLTTLVTSAWGYPVLIHRLGRRMKLGNVSTAGFPLAIAALQAEDSL